MGHHHLQAYQHMNNGNHRRRKEREGADKIFEEIMEENLPKLMKNINLKIEEAQQTQISIK